MRVIKWVLGLLFLLLLLVAVGIAFFVHNFDANAYKERIIQTVKKETGRDLSLNGELKTSFYPWLGVELNDASLSNAQGFSAEKFLQIETASIRLQLLSLLKKNVVADRIQFNGVNVWLERNAQGVTNWDDVVTKYAQNENSANSGASQADSEVSGSIAGFILTNANVQWLDEQKKQDLSVAVKRFETGELKQGAETTLNTEFSFALENPLIQGQVKISGSTKLSDLENFVFSKPQVSIDLQGIDTQAENIHAELDVNEIRYIDGVLSLAMPNIAYEIRNMPSLGERAEGTIQGKLFTVKEGVVNFPEASVSLDLSGSAFPGESLSSTVQAAALSIDNKVLAIKGLHIEGQAKGEPWPTSGVSGDLQAGTLSLDINKDTVSIPAFTAKALDVVVQGSVSGSQLSKDILALSGRLDIAEFSPKAIAKTFSIDLPDMGDDTWTQAKLSGDYQFTKNTVSIDNMQTTIDGSQWQGKASIDDLEKKKLSFDLAAETLDANRFLPPEQAEALQDKKSNAENEAAINAIIIPQEPLKDWDAKGRIRIGKLTVANIVATKLDAGINLLDSKLRVYPAKAEFFGGQYSGDLRLDVSGSTPRLQANESIKNIDLGAMGDALWTEQMMIGQTDGKIILDTKGATVGAMRENAKGDIDFKITNGELQGFDLNYAVAKATALFRSEELNVTDTKKTPFQALSASATVDNGVLQNDDFLAVMPRMRIRGNGRLSLIDTSISYQVAADVLESKSAASDEVQLSLDELVGATIPIKITGNLFEPKVRPDVAAYLQAKLEQDLKDKARDKLKDKLDDQLGGVLGGLLGGDSTAKPTEPEQEPNSTDTSPENAPAKAEPEVNPEAKPEEEPDPVEQKKDELEQKAKDKLKDLFG